MAYRMAENDYFEAFFKKRFAIAQLSASICSFQFASFLWVYELQSFSQCQTTTITLYNTNRDGHDDFEKYKWLYSSKSDWPESSYCVFNCLYFLWKYISFLAKVNSLWMFLVSLLQGKLWTWDTSLRNAGGGKLKTF